jgi:SAM-dependent methyltransferase
LELPLVLEAGCGLIRYVEPEYHPVLLDYSFTAVAATRGAVVGNVECLPFKSGIFTIVICVGSVLNLVDPELAIRELIRVTSPLGLLIIEYERSESFLTAFTPTHGQDIALSVCEYQGVQHPLRLYSDRFIDSVVQAAGGIITQRMFFHIFSAALLRLFGMPSFASLADWTRSLPMPGFIRRRAANVIILARQAELLHIPKSPAA